MTTKKAPEKSASKVPAKKTPAPPTPPAAHRGYRILALQVENIKRISFARIRPQGGTVLVGGKNGQGKTSLLDAISYALTGTRQLPSNPIKVGQNSAKIQVDMGDYLVERTFTRVHGGKEPFITRLAVFGKDKRPYSEAQTLIDKLRGVISFDPLKFLQMPADKQLETVRKLATLDVDIDELDERKKKVYDDRREAGREETSAKARLAAIPAPAEDLPKKRVATAVFADKIQAANAANEERAQLVRKKDDLEAQAQRHRDRVAALQVEAAELRRRAAEMDKEVDEENRKGIACDDEDAKIKVPDAIDTAAILAELQKANDLNLQIQKADQFRAVEKEVADALAKWEGLDKEHKDLEAQRAAAVERAKMPIENLSIGDGEVLFNKLPFSQASNAEQIRVAVAMAIASNPELRVLRIMDGSLLDDDSLAMIEEMADKGDFQVWIERVGGDGKVGIIMENGEASGAEVERVP